MIRRDYLKFSALAGIAPLLAGTGPSFAQEKPAEDRREFCAFIKFIQSLPYPELARSIRTAGYTGIEATIRKGGIIEPADAPEKLPHLAQALKEAGCGITLMATDINRADQPLAESTLRAAVNAGVTCYRTAYYRYDLKKPIRPQIAEFRAIAKDLAAMNAELGITGVYQNHAGARNVGASIWDLDALLDGIDPRHLGVAFDIRHATAEGGTTWPVLWQLIEPRVQVLYVKDLVWKDRKPHNVALGKGLVNPAFFRGISKKHPSLPISVHVEYLHEVGTEENLTALKEDLATLKHWL